MSHFSFKPEIYENPFCHHPSDDGWWHFLILFFLKVDRENTTLFHSHNFNVFTELNINIFESYFSQYLTVKTRFEQIVNSLGFDWLNAIYTAFYAIGFESSTTHHSPITFSPAT
jgi:hypothetical protein